MLNYTLYAFMTIATMCTVGCGRGQPGPMGISGVNGQNGVQGAQGIQGIQGNQGPMGSQGTVGPQGPVGATGAEGPQGEQGIQGLRGTQGLPGAVGETGPAGLNGTTVTTVKFCQDDISTFPEYGIVIGNSIYAVYWGSTPASGGASQAFMALILPGSYRSTGGNGCAFTVNSNGSITEN